MEEVADTLVHEVCHIKYDWRYTQADEVRCYIMETKHRKGAIDSTDIKRIIDHVTENYNGLSKGDFDEFNNY